MAVSYYNKKLGRDVHILSPGERGSKYAEELKTGKDKFSGQSLTPGQMSWRAGYMQARSDAQGAFKGNVKKGVIKERMIDKKPHIVRQGKLKTEWK